MRLLYTAVSIAFPASSSALSLCLDSLIISSTDFPTSSASWDLILSSLNLRVSLRNLTCFSALALTALDVSTVTLASGVLVLPNSLSTSSLSNNSPLWFSKTLSPPALPLSLNFSIFALALSKPGDEVCLVGAAVFAFTSAVTWAAVFGVLFVVFNTFSVGVAVAGLDSAGGLTGITGETGLAGIAGIVPIFSCSIAAIILAVAASFACLRAIGSVISSAALVASAYIWSLSGIKMSSDLVGVLVAFLVVFSTAACWATGFDIADELAGIVGAASNPTPNLSNPFSVSTTLIILCVLVSLTKSFPFWLKISPSTPYILFPLVILLSSSSLTRIYDPPADDVVVEVDVAAFVTELGLAGTTGAGGWGAAGTTGAGGWGAAGTAGAGWATGFGTTAGLAGITGRGDSIGFAPYFNPVTGSTKLDISTFLLYLAPTLELDRALASSILASSCTCNFSVSVLAAANFSLYLFLICDLNFASNFSLTILSACLLATLTAWDLPGFPASRIVSRAIFGSWPIPPRRYASFASSVLYLILDLSLSLIETPEASGVNIVDLLESLIKRCVADWDRSAP